MKIEALVHFQWRGEEEADAQPRQVLTVLAAQARAIPRNEAARLMKPEGGWRQERWGWRLQQQYARASWALTAEHANLAPEKLPKNHAGGFSRGSIFREIELTQKTQSLK